MDYERNKLDTRTIDGLYRAVLARTGDPEFAERVKTEAWVAQKMESLK